MKTNMINFNQHLLWVLTSTLISMIIPSRVTPLDGDTLLDSKSGEITIFIQNAPLNASKRFGFINLSRKEKVEIFYLDDHLIERSFRPKSYPVNDTLRIQTSRPYVELVHVFQGIDQLSYLFKKGDTVIFRYPDSIPVAEVLNRKLSLHDVNYELLKRKLICNGDYPAASKLTMPIPPPDNMGKPGFDAKNFNPQTYIKKQKSGLFEQHLSEKSQEEMLLDSLLNEQLISEVIYSHYKSNIDDVSHGLLLEKPKWETEPSLPLKEEVYVSSLNKQDDFIYRAYYRSMLLSFLDKHFFIKKMNPQDISSTPDYRALFDATLHTKQIGKLSKKYALSIYLRQIIQHSSVADIEVYFDKFQLFSQDSTMIAHLQETYNLGEGISTEMNLEDLDKQAYTFKHLLKYHTDKVIYIDFWASWCRPCIAALPDAEQLRERYKNQEVVFLYISIDDSEEAWQKAAKKYGLTSNSFRIANKYSSQLFENLKVTSIPRYLLYDKMGQLVHTNAPGPKGIEIRQLLDQYLRE